MKTIVGWSCVILYVKERQALTLQKLGDNTHAQTHTAPPSWENRQEGAGEKWNRTSRGRTHTELQLGCNTDAEAGRGSKICSSTHNHSNASKSIFKSKDNQSFCLYISDAVIYAHISRLEWCESFEASCVTTEVNGCNDQVRIKSQET